MRRWLWQHPFLALGLCTLLLFLAVEALQAQGATGAAQRLAGPMRTSLSPCTSFGSCLPCLTSPSGGQADKSVRLVSCSTASNSSAALFRTLLQTISFTDGDMPKLVTLLLANNRLKLTARERPVVDVRLRSRAAA